MYKDDARKLSGPELKGRRKQVMRAYRRGINKKQISRDLGLSYPAVCNIVARYERDGPASLQPGKHGRKSGDGRALTVEQEQRIRNLICEKRPEQLKMEFALLSRPAVRQLIEREWKLKARKFKYIGKRPLMAADSAATVLGFPNTLKPAPRC